MRFRLFIALALIAPPVLAKPALDETGALRVGSLARSGDFDLALRYAGTLTGRERCVGLFFAAEEAHRRRDPAPAARAAEMALSAAEGEADPAQADQCRMAGAAALAWAGRIDDAAALVTRIAPLAPLQERGRLGTPALMAPLAVTLAAGGRPAAAKALADSVPSVKDLSDFNRPRAFAVVAAGDPAKAAVLVRDGCSYMVGRFDCLLMIERGLYDLAEAGLLDQAAGIVPAVPNPADRAKLFAYMARGKARSGDAEGALALLTESRRAAGAAPTVPDFPPNPTARDELSVLAALGDVDGVISMAAGDDKLLAAALRAIIRDGLERPALSLAARIGNPRLAAEAITETIPAYEAMPAWLMPALENAERDAATLPEKDRGTILILVAQARARAGEPDRALALLRHADGLVTGGPVHMAHDAVAHALVRAGRDREALALVAEWIGRSTVRPSSDVDVISPFQSVLGAIVIRRIAAGPGAVIDDVLEQASRAFRRDAMLALAARESVRLRRLDEARRFLAAMAPGYWKSRTARHLDEAQRLLSTP
ncbi:MAG TPA: hypothetical protein VED40_13590 [Azospirillaceae bacterium]|nr:hypothetical protein [Azospirillaceae bacterium]